jgi:hypothetical protein
MHALGLSVLSDREPDDVRAFACVQLNRLLQGRARIDTGAHPSRQFTSQINRARTLEASMASQEFCTIGRPGCLPTGKIGKRNAPPQRQTQNGPYPSFSLG